MASFGRGDADQQYIYMALDLSHTLTTENTTRSRWNTSKLNVDNCLEKIIEIRAGNLLVGNLDTETSAKQLIDIFTEVCNTGISKTSILGGHRRNAY